MAWSGWTVQEKRQWRKVVKPAVLERDGYQCKVRIPGTWKVLGRDGAGDRVTVERQCLGVATTVHHTLGSHTKLDMRYLVASCVPCNLRVGDPTNHKDKERSMRHVGGDVKRGHKASWA